MTTMRLVGVELRRDPIWEFTFSGTDCYATAQIHKNSAFALEFRDPMKGTVDFNKKVELVIVHGKTP